MALKLNWVFFVYLSSIILIIFTIFPLTFSQSTEEAPPPASDLCNGVFLSYSYTTGARLTPTLKSDPSRQPYRFESMLTVLNNGLDELKSWIVFVGFQHNEFLVSASNAVLADGSSLPVGVGNGTLFAGYPMTDLKTAIVTAGDVTQMQVQIKLVGTQFGVALPSVPMPKSITLANDGFICPKPTMQGKVLGMINSSFFIFLNFLGFDCLISLVYRFLSLVICSGNGFFLLLSQI